MRYMAFVKMSEDVGEPPAALVEAMGKEMGEAFASGWMVDAGGLYPTSQSIEIRVAAGDLTVTDGPYSEVKEVVGGYSIIEVRSQEEAVAASSRSAVRRRVRAILMRAGLDGTSRCTAAAARRGPSSTSRTPCAAFRSRSPIRRRAATG